MAALEHPRSITVRMLSYPCDDGSFMIKLMAIFLNERVSGLVVIGKRGGLGLVVAALVA